MPTYPIDENTTQFISKAFGAGSDVALSNEQYERAHGLKQLAQVLAIDIATHAPPGRERALAMTHLQEAVSWALIAIKLEGR